MLRKSKRFRNKVSKSSMVAIDGQTGFIHVAPVGSKNPFRRIWQELMNFSQLLVYSAITYKSDNVPTTRQILKMLINARHSLGLTTRLITSNLGDHSFLQGNTVGRVRKLARSFIEGVQSRLGIKILTWAARHASWVLNRFQPVKGATPYELVYGKSYKGHLAEYGEPCPGYIKSFNKGEAGWRLCLFLEKVGRQDTLTDGAQVALVSASEEQTKIGPNIICKPTKASLLIHGNTKQTLEAEALPAAQTDIPRVRC